MCKLKSFFVVIGLSLIGSAASAQLSADKTEINESSGNALISVSVSKPVTGDLYLTVNVKGQWYFFGDSGKQFSSTVTAFEHNKTYSGSKPILSISNKGIEPGIYTLYQVITVPNADNPLDFRQWVGGLAGLSTLELKINLSETNSFSPAVTPPTVTTTTPTKTDCNSAQTTSNNDNEDDDEHDNESDEDSKDDESQEYSASNTCNPVSTLSLVANGKAFYDKVCAICHGSNPGANQNNILKGRDVSKIRDAIKSNKGDVMGVLSGVNDTDLQAVAEYLKSL